MNLPQVSAINLLYSTAEVLTWKSYDSKTVLVLYGGDGENHEAAFSMLEGFGDRIQTNSRIEAQIINGTLILNWSVSPTRIIVPVSQNLIVYMVDRNEAYNIWVLDLPNESPVYNFTDTSNTTVIVRAGYLLRTAAIYGQTLSLTGDVNTTTDIEVMGAPSNITTLSFNGQFITTTTTSYGSLTGTVTYNYPTFYLPTLSELNWKTSNSLPETSPAYDDSLWTRADLTASSNPRNITTPTSFYASDYGYNTGNLLYRGHYVVTGKEKNLTLSVSGGTAFAYSVWLNNTFLGSWKGHPADETYHLTLPIPSGLHVRESAVIALLLDQMGFDEDQDVGSAQIR